MDSPAPPRHPGPPLLLLLAAWLGLATAVAAQTAAPLPPPDTLKRLSVEQLMDLVVTSVSKRPEKLAAAPAAIQVVSGDDIRRAGASSLPEALRLATNLEVAQIDARQWAITARGFNNVFADKMLVLIDGRSVYTPLYAGVYWDVQDTMLADVDRIEVISGPGATQWGANAVNGVINLTTRSARDTQGGLFVAGAGTALRGAAELRYGGVLGRDLYVRVYGKSFERDDSLRSNGQPAGDAWRAHQAGFRADWERPDRTVTIQGDLYRATMDQPGPGKIHADGGNLLGRWVRQFSTDSDLKLQVYYDRTHRRMPGSFEQTLNTADIDLQHRLPLAPGHDFLWGGGYRVVADDIVNTPANAFLPAQVTRESFNAFLQDEITLQPDRLHVTVGTKLEHNDYTGFEFQPSVRFAWTPTRQQTLWAAVSRAVRTPSRIDRDLFSPAAPPYHIAGGGAGVVSEKLLAYELGWRAQPDPRLALSVATFVNVYDDLRSLEPLNPPQAFPVQSSSGLRGRSSGAELTADWQATARWRIRAGWTELRVHSEPQPGTLDRGTRDSIARDPNHQFFLRSSFDLSARWEFDAAVRCVSRIGQAAVPGYTEADARLGWRPSTAWEFSLLGQNLLHARHAEFNAPGARRQLSRSVLAKATWSF